MDNLAMVAHSPSVLAGVDVLGIKRVPLEQDQNKLDTRLHLLIDRAERLLADPDAPFPFVPERGLMRQLKTLERHTRPGSRQREIATTVQGLQSYFNHHNAEKPESNNAQIRFFVSEDRCLLFMSAIPPRKNGSLTMSSLLLEQLRRTGVEADLAQDQLDRILREALTQQDIVWCALLAQGALPVPNRLDRIEFSVPFLNKNDFRADVKLMKSALATLWRPVRPGDEIGRLKASHPAQPGVDVFGQPIEGPGADIPFAFSQDIEVGQDGTLRANESGYVVQDGLSVYIVPVYIMLSAETGTVNLTFSGAVLVQGDLVGPGRVQCDDLYVLGNCEQIEIDSASDVFVAGGIIGHHRTRIDVDGCLYAGFASEARLSALGEIVISNAIVNSQVVSNDKIEVTAPKGMIAGGSLMCLRDIIAPTIGSEFGMLTETSVGRDFLTEGRIQDIESKVAQIDRNLQKIGDLKKALSGSRISIENLPPEKQEIYIGVLRKERASREELKNLDRRRKILHSGVQAFIQGSVRVLSGLYPPVRVQIGDAIEDIRERLRAVQITYDQTEGKISRADGETMEQHEEEAP